MANKKAHNLKVLRDRCFSIGRACKMDSHPLIGSLINKQKDSESSNSSCNLRPFCSNNTFYGFDAIVQKLTLFHCRFKTSFFSQSFGSLIFQYLCFEFPYILSYCV